MSFKEITPEQAWEMVQNGAMLADIRDSQRFTYSHAKGAFHLTNQSFLQFLKPIGTKIRIDRGSIDASKALFSMLL